jgi:hypothetical protein
VNASLESGTIKPVLQFVADETSPEKYVPSFILGAKKTYEIGSKITEGDLNGATYDYFYHITNGTLNLLVIEAASSGSPKPGTGTVLEAEPARQGTALQVESAVEVESILTDGTNTPTQNFSLNRPSTFRKTTIEASWEGMPEGSQPSTKACPSCGSDVAGNPHLGEPRGGPNGWDVSHNPSWSKRPTNWSTRAELLDDFNSGVSGECKGCNRGNNDHLFPK